ncbi:cytochrome oxidase assembly protein ShyY1 [Neomicrococcus aestuarii]|uniref:SURF1-like protein n=1 Tax=Neomicrococcus aestuarii TaxID=556325 RepID=A0A7W8X0U7_9MICC|nr:SURF1 family cytochrome oxidase biogenesis protein [Neomicrococcus aestuarii]MBB5513607.1 cytochrome oxidase assembly protein ShyY1 [Neomicrococcus aestuarii]
MLRTALKLNWILSLVLALAVATGFVLLSQWQFERSSESAPPAPTTTENAVPLTQHFVPNQEMFGTVADQIVEFTGEIVPDSTFLVKDRLNEGVKGYWVVSAIAVDGAPENAVMPVVRGWTATNDWLDKTADPEPAGQITVEGRLLPPEAPVDEHPDVNNMGSLSPAQLTNQWDRVTYSGFVTQNNSTVAGLTPAIVDPQPQETPINWLNIFYGFEWVVFAGFAIFMWWRLVADDYRRQQEDEADLAEWQAQQERLAQPDNQLHGDDQHADREPTPHSPSAKE